MNTRQTNHEPGDLEEFAEEIDGIARDYLAEKIRARDEVIIDMLSDIYADLLCKDLRGFLAQFKCECKASAKKQGVR